MSRRAFWCFLVPVVPAAVSDVFRPPAIPLITTDPYMQVWMMGSEATSDVVRHWDQRSKDMLGLVRLQGDTYRFLGDCAAPGGQACPIPPMRQISVEVLPTRTLFRLQDPKGRVELNVTFLSTMFSRDYARLSRPVSYVIHDVRSFGGAAYDVQLYLDMTAEHVVNDVKEEVVWGDFPLPPGAGQASRGSFIGTRVQNVLGLKGDQTNINWGYLYLADVSLNGTTQHRAGSASAHRENFVLNGVLPDGQDFRRPRAASDDLPALSLVRELPQVGLKAVRHVALVAYDDIRSVSFYNEGQFPAFWTQTWPTVGAAIDAAGAEVNDMLQQSVEHDASLLANLTAIGGEDYARYAGMVYRQTLAATKLVWNSHRGVMWNFLKEISTNGDMQTMDVIYPASPMFIYSNPELLKLLLVPVLAFANNETATPFSDPYSPHQIGTYPLADHCTGDQEPMPMENTGNMFLMLLGIVRAGVDPSFLSPYWLLLQSWADYLQSTLPFPEEQLCTDDFEGRLANNTNLAAKGIVALEAFATLAEEGGAPFVGSGYRDAARGFAQTWQRVAWDEDHSTMAFGLSGTYSIKYNLVWQKILGLDGPFDWASVATAEVAYYKAKANAFGTPLDQRHTYSKPDWLSWGAVLADSEADFRALFEPIYKQANSTACRVPLTDLFDTVTADCPFGKQGFVARPVTGGVYAKMLTSSLSPLRRSRASASEARPQIVVV